MPQQPGEEVPQQPGEEVPQPGEEVLQQPGEDGLLQPVEEMLALRKTNYLSKLPVLPVWGDVRERALNWLGPDGGDGNPLSAQSLKKGELRFILPCFYIYFMNPLTQ